MKSAYWLIVLNIAWISSAISATILECPQMIIAPALGTIIFIAVSALAGSLNTD